MNTKGQFPNVVPSVKPHPRAARPSNTGRDTPDYGGGRGLRLVRPLERGDCSDLSQTPEGRAAPLQRLDVHDAPPDALQFARSLHFTPTFVLMVDGVEASRIEGYPGEDFFWGLLGQMLIAADVPLSR